VRFLRAGNAHSSTNASDRDSFVCTEKYGVCQQRPQERCRDKASRVLGYEGWWAQG
jgi:hypothetical protein